MILKVEKLSHLKKKKKKVKSCFNGLKMNGLMNLPDMHSAFRYAKNCTGLILNLLFEYVIALACFFVCLSLLLFFFYLFVLNLLEKNLLCFLCFASVLMK